MLNFNEGVIRQRISVGLVSALVSLGGCQQYPVNINGHNVYQPPQLFNDFVLVDPGLSSCVKHTIREQKITKAIQLLELRCNHGGIKSTEGIEIFSSLVALNLAHNQLTDTTGLNLLPKLQLLDLSHNPSSFCAAIKPLADKGVNIVASQCPAR